MAGERFWNDERVSVIRAHAATHTAAEIALLFDGVSRNAIIGVAHREGIQLTKRREYHPPKNGDARRARRPQQEATISNSDKGSNTPKHPRPAPQIPMPSPEPPIERRVHHLFGFEQCAPGETTLWNIGYGQCRWPIGHNGTLATYCGRPTEHTYCPFHTRVRGGGSSKP